MNNFLKTIATGFIAGVAGAYSFTFLVAENMRGEYLGPELVEASQLLTANMRPEPYLPAPRSANELPDNDFVEASSIATPNVVYIKTVAENDYGRNSWLEFFFGGGGGQTISSGSGVIYTVDGYIVTNNHVVDGADNIEVIHGKDYYQARIVGKDPSTDLAVLKVEGKNLPAAKLGSSKNLQIGEWVLAVGNPFNLTSTVTAGIVSAKGREINILKSRFPLESFIQTDAAINPGNSGGALVNRKGELVGINTAILSRTGSYAGYGFAVPSDIMRKVVDDIIEYGEVQKAFLGADVMDLNQAVAQQLDISERDGVVISYLQRDGAAEKAGLRKGDILLSIDGEAIESHSQFAEKISYYSPGDKITLRYKRNGKVNTESLVLTNKEGTTDLITRRIYTSELLGAELETVPQVEKDVLRITSGVRVNQVSRGLMRQLGIEEGFIITAINRKEVDSPEKLEQLLDGARGRVIVEGVNKQGVRGYYSFVF